MAKTKNKEMTIEDLAVMTGNGFNEVRENFKEVKKEIKEFKVEINNRFDRIENILIMGHEHRIEILEDKIILLKTTVEKLVGKELK
jgi:hypothetical protein